MSVSPIRDGYHAVTPYLMVDDVDALLGFLQSAFGAEITERLATPDGEAMHAEVRVRDSMLMVSAARPEWPAVPTVLYLYVEDADGAYRQALDAGAKSIMEPADMPYGDRHGGVQDPTGNTWWIATHIEDVSGEEIIRRMQGETGP